MAHIEWILSMLLFYFSSKSLLAECPTSEEEEVPDENILKINNTCLVLFNSALTWDEAESVCEAHGGVLVHDDSEERHRDLEMLLYGAVHTAAGGDSRIWLGGKWFQLVDFTWLNNAPYKGGDVQPTSQLQASESFCGLIEYNQNITYKYEIKADRCVEQKNALCSGEPENYKGISSQERTFEVDGTRYVVIVEYLTWHDALEKCQSYGLALATNYGDAVSELDRANQRLPLWIGLRKAEWRFVDGKRSSAIRSYQRWGLPPGGTFIADRCLVAASEQGSIWNYVWNYADCQTKLPFLCQFEYVAPTPANVIIMHQEDMDIKTTSFNILWVIVAIVAAVVIILLVVAGFIYWRVRNKPDKKEAHQNTVNGRVETELCAIQTSNTTDAVLMNVYDTPQSSASQGQHSLVANGCQTRGVSPSVNNSEAAVTYDVPKPRAEPTKSNGHASGVAESNSDKNISNQSCAEVDGIYEDVAPPANNNTTPLTDTATMPSYAVVNKTRNAQSRISETEMVENDMYQTS